MKKFLIISLMLIVSVFYIFAGESKFTLGASFGSASMKETTFNNAEVLKKSGTFGLGANIRADYELVKDIFLTGIVGWEMPDRTFIVGTNDLSDVTEKNQHYITVFIGASMGHMKTEPVNEEEIEIVWTGSVGPELWINLTKGAVGFGVKSLLKGSYLLGSNITLDLVADVGIMGIKDTSFDSKVHTFVDMGIKAGCTYSF